MEVIKTKVGPSLILRDIITITPNTGELSRVSLDITGVLGLHQTPPGSWCDLKAQYPAQAVSMQTADIIPPWSDVWLPGAGLWLVTRAQNWPLIGWEPILYLGSLQPVVRLLITSLGLIANVKTISRIFGNVQVSVRLDSYSTLVSHMQRIDLETLWWGYAILNTNRFLTVSIHSFTMYTLDLESTLLEVICYFYHIQYTNLDS